MRSKLKLSIAANAGIKVLALVVSLVSTFYPSEKDSPV